MYFNFLPYFFPCPLIPPPLHVLSCLLPLRLTLTFLGHIHNNDCKRLGTQQHVHLPQQHAPSLPSFSSPSRPSCHLSLFLLSIDCFCPHCAQPPPPHTHPSPCPSTPSHHSPAPPSHRPTMLSSAPSSTHLTLDLQKLAPLHNTLVTSLPHCLAALTLSFVTVHLPALSSHSPHPSFATCSLPPTPCPVGVVPVLLLKPSFLSSFNSGTLYNMLPACLSCRYLTMIGKLESLALLDHRRCVDLIPSCLAGFCCLPNTGSSEEGESEFKGCCLDGDSILSGLNLVWPGWPSCL